jgi:hypothetical protein
MEDPIEIIYTFRFDNGSIKEFTIHLDRQTLAVPLQAEEMLREIDRYLSAYLK